MKGGVLPIFARDCKGIAIEKSLVKLGNAYYYKHNSCEGLVREMSPANLAREVSLAKVIIKMVNLVRIFIWIYNGLIKEMCIAKLLREISLTKSSLNVPLLQQISKGNIPH